MRKAVQRVWARTAAVPRLPHLPPYFPVPSAPVLAPASQQWAARKGRLGDLVDTATWPYFGSAWPSPWHRRPLGSFSATPGCRHALSSRPGRLPLHPRGSGSQRQVSPRQRGYLPRDPPHPPHAFPTSSASWEGSGQDTGSSRWLPTFLTGGMLSTLGLLHQGTSVARCPAGPGASLELGESAGGSSEQLGPGQRRSREKAPLRAWRQLSSSDAQARPWATYAWMALATSVNTSRLGLCSGP